MIEIKRPYRTGDEFVVIFDNSAPFRIELWDEELQYPFLWINKMFPADISPGECIQGIHMFMSDQNMNGLRPELIGLSSGIQRHTVMQVTPRQVLLAISGQRSARRLLDHAVYCNPNLCMWYQLEQYMPGKRSS